jgi:hypothetical protein
MNALQKELVAGIKYGILIGVGACAVVAGLAIRWIN